MPVRNCGRVEVAQRSHICVCVCRTWRLCVRTTTNIVRSTALWLDDGAHFRYFDALVRNLKTEDEGVDELCLAAESNDARAVRALLDRGVCSINEKGSAGRTALMVACTHGCNEAVKALLNYHLQARPATVQADYGDSDGGGGGGGGGGSGMSPTSQRRRTGPNSFAAAVESWRRQSVCDANERTVDGLTALLLAAYAGQAETVMILLRRVTDGPRRVPTGIAAPLRLRQSQRNLMLPEGSAGNGGGVGDISMPNVEDWWPGMAAEIGLTVNISCVLPSGASSLHLATQQCHANVVAVLTDMGMDGEGPCPGQMLLNLHNGFGQTPLSMSAERGRVDIMEMLLDAKANVELAEATDLACPPLVCAAKLGVSEAVSCLLRASANVNAAAADQTTALYHVCYRGDDALAKRLLDLGAKLEVRSARKCESSPLAVLRKQHTFFAGNLAYHGGTCSDWRCNQP